MKTLLKIIAIIFSGMLVLGATFYIVDNTRTWVCIGFAFTILVAVFAPTVFKKFALGITDKICSYRGGKNVDKPKN